MVNSLGLPRPSSVRVANSRANVFRVLAVQSSRADFAMKATLPKPASVRPDSTRTQALEIGQILPAVHDVLADTEIIDIHTHLFAPSFGKLGLWGIDELLTYHYLEAEFFRSSQTTPDQYFALSITQQADAICPALFIENTQISESTRGVVAVLKAFGLPTDAENLAEARAFFGSQSLDEHIQRVFEMAGISTVVMTNDPLDPEEAPVWLNGVREHPQFRAVLRLDKILRQWTTNWPALAAQGYKVDAQASGKSTAEVQRFLFDWCERMRPIYMAVSLPDTFLYPAETLGNHLLTDAVLLACLELNLPISLMIGVRLQVNPTLRLAGDALGRADLRSLENLCRTFPKNRFLVSVLSRENQHELCVYARKFSNLMPFGCWWFLNNPSIVEEITRERIEMLGTSFIPQHSDARVLEQVIYKWSNTRRTLAPILANAYRLLVEDGGRVSRNDIARDITRLFRSNAERWMNFNKS